ncbi:UDP-N-acetyl-D-glucosamine 2-epimerase, UDP-hydrolysing [Syntrophotalea acetylenivorans]|uniref:UDP-N-acetyl-D-glucosamine 2-epimerase, UDP-hydrolysing n=1 Tax=Syntrophotalea acetylenivorans TaxID=1842532 RepID=A0A1L3GN49_9BACT|nr:UDP-N-acetylglucosamine 2-epimerase [Syntrophotalea acetylenivorans]APG27352.1 UDP-N-acetyl-D-glucosamine 2-epimerase, UDP-hydrolysing [Syntrophotalea acetylenivorans]
MKTIGVVTSSRADYGIYLPVLRAILAEPNLRLQLFVTGMHLAPEFGLTVRAIEKDGFPIAERVEALLSADSPAGTAISMGLSTQGFAMAFARTRPDILLVLGDRFEMHAAALAALPFKIPLAHIHGGEITRGAIDESLRHSLTKLSHLHFVTTEEYRRRVIQLGEEPWRVTMSGAPGLDNLRDIQLLPKKEFHAQFGINLEEGTLLVTYHPVTLEYEQTGAQVNNLLAALQQSGRPLLFTLANADTLGREINCRIREFVAGTDKAQMVDSLGTQGYFSAMALVDAMVGNSSSGIIEAASFNLPVVNIGNRQQGRVRAGNVIDTGYSTKAIQNGISHALDPAFRHSLSEIANPYGEGRAASLIVERLLSAKADDRLLHKAFFDLDSRQQE